MRLTELVQQLQALAVTLTPHPNGNVRCRAGHGAVSSAVRAAMQQQKAILHELVEAWSERAAMAEYCGGLQRGAAEAAAWNWLLTQVDGVEQCQHERP
jgi:hypothetical protein